MIDEIIVGTVGVIMLLEVICLFATWLAIFIIGIVVYFALIISYENRIEP